MCELNHVINGGKQSQSRMLSSTNANWPGDFEHLTIGRAPSDTHMQSPITSVLFGHSKLRCQWHARPKSGTTPIEFGVLRRRLGKACLTDCFSQKHFNSLIQFAEEFRFFFGVERRRR